MPLATGTHFGPYEILAPLGAGGMGEVYRARDTRLGRDVAVKVLPAGLAGDADRQRRFEQEARAAARLNNPNILHIYDVGQHEGQPYLVTELLEGETLRDRMAGEALPIRKSVELAIAIAHGLAAAHEQGIVHRDLKPENLFVTGDGRLKILDFGLAKLTRPDDADGALTLARSLGTDTDPGVVLGTVGYMSPEQVRGQHVDHRSDLFSLGAILYEMLSGKRAFRGDSPADTMSAILREDPSDLTAEDGEIPLALERIVRHCLEKSPGERFRSAHDLAFQLEGLSSPSGPGALEAPAAGGAAAAPRAVTRFRQLTYNRGTLYLGRFAPDGQTVVYAATWDEFARRLYMKRPESPDAIPLQVPSADILAISPTGEMAIQLSPRWAHNGAWEGTLATALLFGGAPRELAEHVVGADFAPSGDGLMVARDVDGKGQIEFPIGHVLYRTEGHVSYPRFAPDGRSVAFLDHPLAADDRGTVALVDLEGNKKTLTREWASAQGLAWSASGEEVWFTAADSGSLRSLYAVRPSGGMRSVSGFPGSVRVMDIAKDGRVLLTRDNIHVYIAGKAPGDERERNLGWLDWSLIADLTPDGRTVLFDEENQDVGADYVVCVRKTDGSPLVRLGEGSAQALSPDGRWALARLPRPGSPLMLLPTGPGQRRILETTTAALRRPRWLPDGKKFFYLAEAEDGLLDAFLYDVGSGASSQIHSKLPSHSLRTAISPDGLMAAVSFTDGSSFLLPLDGGTARPGPALEESEQFVAWSRDGHWLYVERIRSVPLKVHRVRASTGEREFWREFMPADSSGVVNSFNLQLDAEGDAYAYSYGRALCDLYIAEGVV